MLTLAQLPIHDLRPRLSVKPNPPELSSQGIISRRNRVGPVLGTVIHYNGPAVPFRADTTKVIEFIVNVDTLNHQQRIGADSLCYHFVVLNSGQIYQTRDLNLIAWHAGNKTANESYLAIHLPLGGDQTASLVQWNAVVELHEALAHEYQFANSAITGHCEWSNTACPGLDVFSRIKTYRSTTTPNIQKVQVTAEDFLNVRQGPTADYKIAGTLKPGQIVEVDSTKDEGQGVWWHLASGWGFINSAFTKIVQ